MRHPPALQETQVHLCINSLEQEHIFSGNGSQHKRAGVDIVEYHRIHGDVNNTCAHQHFCHSWVEQLVSVNVKHCKRSEC